MPIYEYQGQQYQTEETDPNKALEKIKSHLGTAAPAEIPPSSSGILGELKDTALRLGQGAVQLGVNAAGAGLEMGSNLLGENQNAELGAVADQRRPPTQTELITGKKQSTPVWTPFKSAEESLITKGQEAQNYLETLKTPQQQAANKGLQDQSGVLNSLSYMKDNPSTIVDMFEQSLPSMLGMVAPVREAGQTAFTEALTSGLTKEEAKKAALAAAGQAELIVNGGMEGVSTEQQQKQRLLTMPEDELLKNPHYQELVKLYGPEEARRALSETNSQIAGNVAGVIGAAATGLTGAGKFEAEALTGGAGKRALTASLAKGVGKEFTEEGIQSGGDQFGMNVGDQATGMDTPLMQGVPEQAVQGALVGAVGGVPFGIAHAYGTKNSPSAEAAMVAADKVMQEATKAQNGEPHELDAALAELSKHADVTDLKARLINNSPTEEIYPTGTPLPPEREAMLGTNFEASQEQLDAAEAKSQVATTPVPPEMAYDGTTTLGLDSVMTDGGEVNLPPVVQPDGQIGESRKGKINSFAYENSNDLVPRSERVITQGPAGSVGRTLGQIKTQPGTYSIGVPTADRTPALISATHELYETLRQRFMPNSTIILSNEGMERGSLGSSTQLASGEHLIIPAFARQFSPEQLDMLQEDKRRTSENYNRSTQAKNYYNAFHEFGHALKKQRFFENVSPAVSAAFDEASRQGVIPEELIAQFPEGHQALIREYNADRARVDKMTAEEFQHTWMSPALAHQRQLIKVEAKSAPGLSAKHFITRMLATQLQSLRTLDAKRATLDPRSPEGMAATAERDALMAKEYGQYLSFDEWFSEQMAWYEYSQGVGKGTALASNRFFGPGLQALRGVVDSLRAMYAELKKGIIGTDGKTYRIAAGQSFTDYINSLPASAQMLGTAKGVTLSVSETKAMMQKVEENRGRKGPPPYAADMARGLLARGNFTAEQQKEIGELLNYGNVSGAFAKMNEIAMKSEVHRQTDLPTIEDQITGLPTIDHQGSALDSAMMAAEFWQERVDNVQASLDRIAAAPMQTMQLAKLTRDAKKLLAENKVELANAQAAVQKLQKTGKVLSFHRQLLSVTDTMIAGIEESDTLRPEVQLAAIKEWKEKDTMSRFFQRWFGDWKEDPKNASKVVAGDGKPLMLFHGTRAVIGMKAGDTTFTVFRNGDVGSHFGGIAAAHTRAYVDVGIMPSSDEKVLMGNVNKITRTAAERIKMHGYLDPQLESAYIIPVFLNIRNPISLGVENPNIWANPIFFVENLPAGILSNEEKIALMHEAKNIWYVGNVRGQAGDMAAAFSRIVEVLKSKGFDGLHYENVVESGRSWVVFDPEQVKSAYGNATFSPSQQFHRQTDTELSTEWGAELDTFEKTLAYYGQTTQLRSALSWFTRKQWVMLQLQQLAHIHPEFRWLSSLNSAMMKYFAYKSNLQADGEKLAHQWMWLGKENDAKLARILEEEVTLGEHKTLLIQTPDNTWTHVASVETLAWMKSRGIDTETRQGKKLLQIFIKSKNVQLQHLEAATRIMEEKILRMVPDLDIAAARIHIMRGKMKELRNTPWLPRGDYGSFGFTVRKRDGLATETVGRYLFESLSEMKAARIRVEGQLKNGETLHDVSWKFDKLGKDNIPILALPQEFLDLAPDILDLSTEQIEALHELLHPIKQDKLLRAYDAKLQKLAGGSPDRMRNFANFVWHSSTQLAKADAKGSFNAVKRDASAFRRRVDASALPIDQKMRLLEDVSRSQHFVESTIGYTLSPPDEMYGLRSVVSYQFLSGNLKTAVLNLVGLLTTVTSTLTQSGLLNGSKYLGQAHAQLARSFVNLPIDPKVDTLYQKAIAEGILDQSYAAHLAGISTNGVMTRLFNRGRFGVAGEIAGKSIYAGLEGLMLPFRAAEQYTRRITFLSEINRLLDEHKLDKRIDSVQEGEIYSEAVRMTDLLQNSYTLANRPVMMRGGGKLGGVVPLATIFLSFMQHMSFHGYGGFQMGMSRQAGYDGKNMNMKQKLYTASLLASLFLLAGLEGLPGMQNLFDLLDILYHNLIGKSFRMVLREQTKQLPKMPEATHFLNEPNWWMHGFGHNIAGFNVSNSLGIGKLIPGTDGIELANDPQGFLGGMAIDFMGVAGADALFATTIAMDAMKGKSLTQDVMRTPGVIGNIATAYQWAKVGVRDKNGALIYEPTDKDIGWKVAGFNPADLAEKRQLQNEQYREATYWKQRRDNLLDIKFHADEEADREAIADADKAIDGFNGVVPDGRMKIKGTTIRQSRVDRHKANRRKENDLPPQKSQQGIYEGVASSETPNSED